MEIVTWLEEKIPFDLDRVFSLIAYILVEAVSVTYNVIVSLHYLQVSSNVQKIYDAISAKVNPISPLISTVVDVVYPIKSCNFSGLDTDIASSLVSDFFSIAIVLLLLTGLSLIFLTFIIIFKFIKLFNSKQKKDNAKSKGNEAKSTIHTVYDMLGLALVICDEVLIFAVISYMYASYNGSTGYGCLMCLLQIETCTTNTQYKEMAATAYNAIIVCFIKTLLLVVKKMVLKFFNWTQTGTIFDLVIIRLMATITFTILSIIFVYTPGFFVLKSYYFSKIVTVGTIPNVIKTVANIGLMLWAVIILMSTCYGFVLILFS